MARDSRSPFLAAARRVGEYDERSDLDALARRHARRTFGVHEAGMSGVARTAVVTGVEALEQQHLVRLHVAHVVPVVLGTVAEGIDLARVTGSRKVIVAVMLDARGDEIGRRDAAVLADGQRDVPQ